jgi:predicted GH43/DUF377 family glycosyl hydrolase
MTDLATYLPIKLTPDSSRTVIRPFSVEDPSAFAVKDHTRAQRIVDRIMTLDDATLKADYDLVSKSLDDRHQNVEAVLLQRYEELEGLTIDRASVSRLQGLLIGAYFSEEFSFESAALFNPSVVSHPDQSGVASGDTRFVLSLRGIGEGHISSLTFRTGTWKADGSVTIDQLGPHAVGPNIDRREQPDGQTIVKLTWDGTEEISEAVIYPFMPSQGRGIEDVRMVEFTDDDGVKDYRATYTAFNGTDVRQGLLHTADFKAIEARGVQGDMYSGKGMALFPRRIDGRYYMLGRQDNENIWLLSSDDPYTWNGGQKIIEPKFPWEFVQMGNCGSPIELDEGWLVLTHGVGVVRNYCVGASLLDKKDPSKLLARLGKPLLEPTDKQRDGYVPNVVYSCGAMLRDRTLLLPYGEADNFAAFATVEIDALLAAMS